MGCDKLTIGTPFYNSAWCFKEYADGLLNLSYPKPKIELVFMDNESTDNTLQLLNGFKEEHDSEYYAILIDSCPHTYPDMQSVNSLKLGNNIIENIARTRNWIIQSKHPDTNLVFIDSDSVPPSNGIERLLKMTKKPYYGDVCSGITIEPTTAYYVEFPTAAKQQIEELIRTNLEYVLHKFLRRVPSFDFSLEFNIRGEPVPICSLNNILSLPPQLRNKILEAKLCGFGFVLIKNQVLQEQSFETDQTLRGFVGEDYHFCNQARQLGFKVLVDTNLWYDHLHWLYDKDVETIKLKGVNPKARTIIPALSAFSKLSRKHG